jgi:hypothetical protein
MSPLERELLTLAWQIDIDMREAAGSARTILGIDAHGPEGRMLNDAVCALVSQGYVEFGSFERAASPQDSAGASTPWRSFGDDADALKRYLAANAAVWTVFPGDLNALRRYLDKQWRLASHPLHIGEIGWLRITPAGVREAERLGINESPIRHRGGGGQ